MKFSYLESEISEAYFKDVSIKREKRDKTAVMTGVSKIAKKEINNKKIEEFLAEKDSALHHNIDTVSYFIKHELQDFSFHQINPERYPADSAYFDTLKELDNGKDFKFQLAKFLPSLVENDFTNTFGNYCHLFLNDVEYKHNKEIGKLEIYLEYRQDNVRFGNCNEYSINFDEGSAIVDSFFDYCFLDDTPGHWTTDRESFLHELMSQDPISLYEILPGYSFAAQCLGNLKNIKSDSPWLAEKFKDLYNSVLDWDIDIDSIYRDWSIKNIPNFIKTVIFNKKFVDLLKNDIRIYESRVEKTLDFPVKIIVVFIDKEGDPWTISELN